MSEILCELCGKSVAPFVLKGQRCAACLMRLGIIDADVRKFLGDKWRLEDGLRYARWAVLDIPTVSVPVWSDFNDVLDNFSEVPWQMFEIVVMGKRQIILFFFDTLA